MRKKSGRFREIEAPEDDLKLLQRQFNAYLQCIYYTLQSQAAYGYIIRIRDSKTYKNILENARQHMGCQYMLNADFKDFFHQITVSRISDILQHPPFQLDTEAANILARLFTKNGRLPMGAPTSPVLSNLATIALDKALTHWAANLQIIFTRFVDDLTFSSKTNSLDITHFEAIDKICTEHGFQFNTTKTKFYDEHNTKKVTGLLLNTTIDIDPGFYKALDKNLKRLKNLAEVNLMMNNHHQADLLQGFKQDIDGQVNFIGMIEGYDSPEFRKYRNRIKAALQADEKIFSTRWINTSYF